MAAMLLRSMLSVALVAGALADLSTSAAQAQTSGGYGPLQISWEVRNRFRLFREERDFLLHAESGARPQRAGFGAGAGDPERRPRLGAQHREPALHRSRRPRQRALHPRQRQGELSDADRSSGHGPAHRPGSGRRHLRLDVRRWRRPANVHLRLRRAGQSPRPLRPHHGRHRRCVERLGGQQRVFTEIAVRDIFIAGLGDSVASGEGNPDRPVALSDEGFCFRSYLGNGSRAVLPAEPRRLQGRPRLRGARSRWRSGSARARSGSIRPATARSTATRPAPRWRSRCDIRTSR